LTRYFNRSLWSRLVRRWSRRSGCGATVRKCVEEIEWNERGAGSIIQEIPLVTGAVEGGKIGLPAGTLKLYY
jgi:hypothetical protein